MALHRHALLMGVLLALVTPICRVEARHLLRQSNHLASRNKEDFNRLLEEAHEEGDAHELECIAKMEAARARKVGVQLSLQHAGRSLQAAAAAEIQLKARQGALYANAGSIETRRNELQRLCGHLEEGRRSQRAGLDGANDLANEAMGIATKMQGDYAAKVSRLEGSLVDQRAWLDQGSKACNSQFVAVESELNGTRAGIREVEGQLKALEDSRGSRESGRANFTRKLAELQAQQETLQVDCRNSAAGVEKKVQDLQARRAAVEGISATDCEVSAWKHGDCSKKCKGGTKTLSREVLRNAAGGAKCPNLSANVPCNTQACEVACELGAWSEWNQCSKLCNGGHRTRSRSVVAPPPVPPAERPAGQEGPELQRVPLNEFATELKAAAPQVTPAARPSPEQPVAVSSASAELAMFDNDEGSACGLTHEVESCNVQTCGGDCTFGQWGSWGPCTKACGSGKRGRRRDRSPAEHSFAGAAICKGWESEFSSCKSEQCSSEGVFTCGARQDLSIMVDASELLTPAEFETQKAFVKGLLGHFTLDRETGTIAGLVVFGSAVPEVLPATDSIDEIENRLFNVTQAPAGQNLDKGLDDASNALSSTTVRNSTKAAPRTVLVLLQGKPDSTTKAIRQAEKLKEQLGVRIVVAVVDKDGSCVVNKRALEQIASEPPEENIFYFKSFQELHDKVAEQAVNLCPSLEGGVLGPTQYLPKPAA